MIYQRWQKKLLCIEDVWNFCMAVVHGGTCIELFAFAVNSISSQKLPNIVLRLARLMIPLLVSSVHTYSTIVCKEVPVPPFQGTHSLTQLPPFFVVPYPLFCSIPFIGILDSSPHPHANPPCPNPTNQVWGVLNRQNLLNIIKVVVNDL